jgi:hypothetical protein
MSIDYYSDSKKLQNSESKCYGEIFIEQFNNLLKRYEQQIATDDEYKNENKTLKDFIKYEIVELLERILNDYASEGYLLDEFITYDIETLLEKSKGVVEEL